MEYMDSKTFMSDALNKSRDLLAEQGRTNRTVILVTDGEPNMPNDPKEKEKTMDEGESITGIN